MIRKRDRKNTPKNTKKKAPNPYIAILQAILSLFKMVQNKTLIKNKNLTDYAFRLNLKYF